MTKKKKKVAAPVPLVLDRKIGIRNIADLVDNLSTLLGSDANIVVDANSVQSVDIAALQVLVAFSNESHRRSKEVEWKHSEGALQEYAELAALGDHLRLGETTAEIEDDGLCPVF